MLFAQPGERVIAAGKRIVERRLCDAMRAYPLGACVLDVLLKRHAGYITALR
jgi:hypothetical protein